MNSSTEIFWDKVNDIGSAMLITRSQELGFHARPMIVTQDSFNGYLYFFSRLESAKAAELLKDSQAIVTFNDPRKEVYASVNGTARLTQATDLMRKHWTPRLKKYFDCEADSRELCLIEIEAHRIEVWDAEKNEMTTLFDTLKSMIGGKTDMSLPDSQVLHEY